jgi:hypothetical protein
MEPANVLKIKTLSEGWIDPDLLMLHACFQVLTDFLEKENPFRLISWDNDEEHIQAKNEIIILHEWWQKRKILEEDLPTLNNRFAPQNIEDTEMLIRLMKVRTFLWV